MQKGVDFEELDVTKDPKALEELDRIAKRRVVPVIEIGGDVIVGFDPKAIEEKLKG